MIISERIEASGEVLASGGLADVRSGRYMGRLVAVKTMRVTAQDNILKIRKVSINYTFPATRDPVLTVLLQRFCEEVVLWSMLSHPNVLGLVGVQGDMEKGQFTTVSEWMVHGNITQYIINEHVNRLELVRDFTFPATSPIRTRR